MHFLDQLAGHGYSVGIDPWRGVMKHFLARTHEPMRTYALRIIAACLQRQLEKHCRFYHISGVKNNLIALLGLPLTERGHGVT